MFPHIPLHAITLDLADTHSVSLTVEHILNETIYIPREEGTPPPTPELTPTLLPPPPGSSQTTPTHLPHSEVQQGHCSTGNVSDDGTSNVISTTAETSRLSGATDTSGGITVQSNGGMARGDSLNTGFEVSTDSSTLRQRTVPTSGNSNPLSNEHTKSDSITFTSVERNIQSDPSSTSADTDTCHSTTRPLTNGGATHAELEPEKFETARAQFIRRGVSRSPLTDPSSPYSFFALQKRKEALMTKARKWASCGDRGNAWLRIQLGLNLQHMGSVPDTTHSPPQNSML